MTSCRIRFACFTYSILKHTICQSIIQFTAVVLLFYLQDLEECQSERHKKYMELRKREETIESFLSTYEDTKQKEKETAAQLKNEIIRTLSAISEHLVTLPATENEYELVQKELAQIDSTHSNEKKSLFIQYKQKELYLEKVIYCKTWNWYEIINSPQFKNAINYVPIFCFQLQMLEGKLQSEIGSLYDRIEKIQSEIAIYENLDALKDEAEQKKTELMEKKNFYKDVQDTLKDELNVIRQKYEEIKVSSSSVIFHYEEKGKEISQDSDL